MTINPATVLHNTVGGAITLPPQGRPLHRPFWHIVPLSLAAKYICCHWPPCIELEDTSLSIFSCIPGQRQKSDYTRKLIKRSMALGYDQMLLHHHACFAVLYSNRRTPFYFFNLVLSNFHLSTFFDISSLPEALQLHSFEFTWFHELVVEAAPGLFALLQVLLHDLDVRKGTVAFWESGRTPAPAVVVTAEQLALWVARHITEGCLHKTPTQELWQDILQAWKKISWWIKNTWWGFHF